MQVRTATVDGKTFSVSLSRFARRSTCDNPFDCYMSDHKQPGWLNSHSALQIDALKEHHNEAECHLYFRT